MCVYAVIHMHVFSRLFREDDPKWLRFSQGSGRNMLEFNYEGVTPCANFKTHL